MQRDQRERIHQRAHNLRRFLQNALERDEKKLAIQRQTLLDAENMDDLRRKGDLITSSLHCIPRGASKAVVPDYYSEDMREVEIPMNPALSPAENAQRYYKQYNKLKAASDLVLDQMSANEAEIAYLEGQLENLELCTTFDELTEIQQELGSASAFCATRTRERSRRRSRSPSRTTSYPTRGSTSLSAKTTCRTTG